MALVTAALRWPGPLPLEGRAWKPSGQRATRDAQTNALLPFDNRLKVTADYWSG